VPRPLKEPEQWIRAYELFGLGLGPRGVRIKLELEFDTPVSLRTVDYWHAKYKVVEEDIKELDKPFQWENMHRYQIPWETSQFVLEMWRFLVEGGRYLNEQTAATYPPTARQLRWSLRVHLACTELGQYDVFWISQRFVRREIFNHVYDTDIGFDDLQAYLAYKPWISREGLSCYLKAVDEGKVSSMDNLHMRADLLRLLTEVGDNTHDRSRAVKLTMDLFDKDSEFLAMIPSEQTNYVLSSLI